MPIETWTGFRRAAAVTVAALALALTPCQSALAKQKASKPASHSAQTAKAKGGHAKASSTPAKRQWTSRSSGRGKWSRASRRVPAARAAVVAPPPQQTPVRATPVPVTPAIVSGQVLVPVAAGGLTSTSARMASDLAAVLDSATLRILPVMTRSSLAEAITLGQADKADLAFLHADLLATLPEAQRPALASRVAYVARLYNEEVHLITARDVNGVRDLTGKKVNVGPEGSANAQTAELIFDRLGVAPLLVHLDQPTALAQLAAGELVGDVLVSGLPVKALQDFTGDGRFKLLPLPFDAAVQDLYLPAKIDSVNYGNLVPPGRSIETLAVPIVLATIDAPAGSPRAARVARFTQALFERFDTLRDPTHHPKWRDVNLAAGVPGWTRFATAQEALDRKSGRAATADTSSDAARPSAQPTSSPDTRLYGEFLQWRRDNNK